MSTARSLEAPDRTSGRFKLRLNSFETLLLKYQRRMSHIDALFRISRLVFHKYIHRITL